MMVRQSDPCPCGSGRIFRNCCLPQMMMMGMAGQGPPGYEEEEPKKEEVREVYEPTRDEIMKASSEERFKMAEKLFAINKEKEAVELLEMILYKREGKLDFIDIFFKVIDYYKKSGNYDRALLFTDELLKYDRECKKGRFADEVSRIKAEILVFSGKTEEGIEIFEKLIAGEPEELWNYYGAANALLEKGYIEKSIVYMEKGIALPVRDIEKVKVLLRRMLSKVKEEEE